MRAWDRIIENFGQVARSQARILAVTYTHLPTPTKREEEVVVVGGIVKKRKKEV